MKLEYIQVCSSDNPVHAGFLEFLSVMHVYVCWCVSSTYKDGNTFIFVISLQALVMILIYFLLKLEQQINTIQNATTTFYYWLLNNWITPKAVYTYIIPGNSTLREIFMKTDNFIHGKFFAHLIKVCLHHHKHESLSLLVYFTGGDGWLGG